jgi:hypothetical protein
VKGGCGYEHTVEPPDVSPSAFEGAEGVSNGPIGTLQEHVVTSTADGRIGALKGRSRRRDALSEQFRETFGMVDVKSDRSRPTHM